MEIKKLRSGLKGEIEKKSTLIFPYDFNKTFKKDTLSINLNDKKIGEIVIRQLTGSHQRFGAISSFVIEAKAMSCILYEKMFEMNFSFIDFSLLETEGFYSIYSGKLKNQAFFKDYGVITFYPHDNIEEKVLEMIDQINSNISIKLLHLFSGNLETINDIASNHESYSYPTLFSALICKINNRMDLLETVIKNCKTKKMKDSSKDNVNEILENIYLIGQ
ncbi:hypothetical protein J0383_08265 [Flavobacterium endoglycinae]|uniref:Uncharacterized protein n=1 Tax=Flavobacterium endoglycinae TaxID=2816357 RepID=A0ABX7QJE1_9FLAO|nr:hypothetical protein [Flavobacterium endoglycinae]QSW90790.1 hypothetical protein J0383_08265 [Flavobacterium endoglycinae]